MRIVVTGAAGFIGTALVQHLSKLGHEVACVDPKINPDLFQWKNWEGMDACIHLGAKTGVRDACSPRDYIETNVQGTLNVLEMCRVKSIPKFILASTSSVYGVQYGKCSEDSDTSKPLSAYAASKKAAEVLAHTYHHLHGLDVTVLRYFTVYGPNGRPEMLIPRIVKAAQSGVGITINGDGRQVRDFTYIGDVVQGTVAALKPMGYSVINIGAGNPVSVRDVIHKAQVITGKEVRYRLGAEHPADVGLTWADNRKAKRELDMDRQWVSIEDGLRECLSTGVLV